MSDKTEILSNLSERCKDCDCECMFTACYYDIDSYVL